MLLKWSKFEADVVFDDGPSSVMTRDSVPATVRASLWFLDQAAECRLNSASGQRFIRGRSEEATLEVLYAERWPEGLPPGVGFPLRIGAETIGTATIKGVGDGES